MPRARATDQRAPFLLVAAAARMRRASSRVRGSISFGATVGASTKVATFREIRPRRTAILRAGKDAMNLEDGARREATAQHERVGDPPGARRATLRDSPDQHSSSDTQPGQRSQPPFSYENAAQYAAIAAGSPSMKGCGPRTTVIEPSGANTM